MNSQCISLHRTLETVETETDTESKHQRYYNDVFVYKDGYLHCEGVRVVDVLAFLQECNISAPYTPCFVYSKSRLVSNVNSYLRPLEDRRQSCSLNYAVKANMNISILKLLRELGCSCTLVSGNELRLCSDLGFRPDTMVLNGNGKQAWEIAIAVNCGCLINVDSLFDLRRISKVCQDLGKSARVLIRVNPDIETNVHRYISTGTKGSKFGISTDSLNDVLEAIKRDNSIKLEGLHCHLGSTITDLNTFRKSSLFLYKLYLELKNGDFPEIHVINVGGGLGIAYNKHVSRTSVTTKDKSTRNIDTIPSPEEVVNVINDVIKDDDVTLILEPGRSLVADAAVFVSAVLGVKSSGETNYIVVDGSMTEVIRPSLYQAYHHIDLAEPTTCEGGKQPYQIVGPVCESGDFLGKDRLLPTPHEGCCMALFDAGAYCASMASNYNMRPRRAEVMVDKTECTLIRKPDTYEDMLEPYLVQEH